MKKIIIAYVPVYHNGYRILFEKHHDVTALFLIGDALLDGELGEEFDYIARKDRLRAIPTSEMVLALRQLLQFPVEELDTEYIGDTLFDTKLSVIMPDEDISRVCAERFLGHLSVEFEPVFLRWHRDNSKEEQIVKDRYTITTEELHVGILGFAHKEAEKSMDWWRQVGAVLVKGHTPILWGHNEHVPEAMMPYIDGDPRSVFSRGVHLELSTAEHSEAQLIAQAARYGIATEGMSIYVTTYPCPPCAKLIASAGIARLYFTSGYAVLDGETILKDVELIRVVDP